jgi:hypothetical protein
MTHQKVALITGITGQNGSYWPIFCWKRHHRPRHQAPLWLL